MAISGRRTALQDIGYTKALPCWSEGVRLPNVEPFDTSAVRAAYDVAAEDYAQAFADDLWDLPVDRDVLDSVARMIAHGECVLDLGCGPGQVGHYLAKRGLRMVGMDLAFQMLLMARRRTGNGRLACGDMRSMPFRTASFSGIIAFYSVHHLPRPELRTALAEVRRILKPTGLLVIATHLGESEVYSSTFLGHEIETVGGTLYGEDELVGMLECGSFVIEDIRYRESLSHEHESRRIYVMSRLTEG
jgi:ubiquinone/menaquinone biosynthesis C-methylase UbiE